jgi:hypothetical protein
MRWPLTTRLVETNGRPDSDAEVNICVCVYIYAPVNCRLMHATKEESKSNKVGLGQR